VDFALIVGEIVLTVVVVGRKLVKIVFGDLVVEAFVVVVVVSVVVVAAVAVVVVVVSVVVGVAVAVVVVGN